MTGLSKAYSLVRYGAVRIDTAGTWSGAWHWPTKIAVMPNPQGDDVARLLEDSAPLRRFHADIVPFVPGVDADLLILDGAPSAEMQDQIRGRIGAVLILDRDTPLSYQDLAATRARMAAGAAMSLSTELMSVNGLIDGLFTALSHDQTFDVALAEPFRWQGKAMKGALTAVLVPDFMIRSRLSTQIESIGRGMRGLQSETSFQISQNARNSFRLPGVDLQMSEPPLADILVGDVGDIAFDQEADSATGGAAAGRALDDAASGPTVRYPDAAVYHGDDIENAERLTSDIALGISETYILEFAFRSQRTGIGFDTEPDPLGATVDEESELLVAIAPGPGSDVDIPEPITTIKIGPSGDSKAARMLFVPRNAQNGRVLIEIRVYYRLNLLECIDFSAQLEPYQGYAGAGAQKLVQANRFEKYAGYLTKALPPVDLAIDVARHDNLFSITVARGKRKGKAADKSLSLHAYADFGGDDLKRRLGAVRDCWLKIGLEVFNQQLKPNSAYSGEEQLRQLAMAGQGLWQLLFQSGPPTGALRAIGNELARSPFPDGARISVKIKSGAHAFVFPWQLLFDREISGKENIDVAGFWGSRYHIEQHLDVSALRPDREEKPPANAHVSMFFDNTIPQSTAQGELIDHWMKVRSPSGSATAFESREGLVERLKSGDDALLYFFCHGLAGAPYSEWARDLKQLLKAAQKNPEQRNDTVTTLAGLLGKSKLDGSDSALKLSKSIVGLKDILSLPDVFQGDPIVFLNMCESAQLFPDANQSFVSFFLHRYAAAVIGTECPVPPIFADELAKIILPELINGASAGETLLSARQAMLDTHRNPLGLAYSLWGKTDAVLI